MSVRVSRLANGLAVVTHEMAHLETVALGVWARAGSRDETAREAGLAHFLEHMAFKGTKRRTAREIAGAIEGRGGDLNASTSTETTGYTAHVLKEDWPLALDVLADILTGPLFDAGEMERERGVILQEIAASLDDPADVVFEQAEAVAFAGHPLGRSVLGTPETVSALTPDDLRGFLRREYTAGRMVLSAAGGIGHDELVEAAGALLSDFAPGGIPQRQAPVFSSGRARAARDQDQTHIVLAWPAPGYLDEEIYAAQAMSSVLGSGMASRLFQSLREERGLCYSVYSYYSPWADTGLLYLYAATAPDKADEAAGLMREEAARMAGGVTEEELARARAQGRAGLVMSLESPSARAGQLARQYLAYGRAPEIAEFKAKIDAVTAEQAAAAARAVFGVEPVVSIVEGRGGAG